MCRSMRQEAVGPHARACCRELIQHLKHWAPGHLYATSLAPPAAQQIMSAMRLLRGEDGSSRGARKLAQLRANSDYFRARLLDMGCNVLGDWGSPVMVLTHSPLPPARPLATATTLIWMLLQAATGLAALFHRGHCCHSGCMCSMRRCF